MAETLLPFQCITWRGFGKTQIKIVIQKLKERKWRRTKERQGEKEERKRRKRKKLEKQQQRMKHSPALSRPLPHCHSSSTLLPDWVRSACCCCCCSSSSSSYLLVLIQLYCKNWIVFCVWIIWDIFWEWSKVRSACSSQQLCFFFFCVFFFYSSNSKETVRNGLITVLRTVRLNRGSNGSLLFLALIGS